MSTRHKREMTNRPCMITETGRVLPLPPKRTPSRSAKSIKLPTRRFGPVFSAVEIQDGNKSHEKSTHKRKISPSPEKVVVKETHKRKKNCNKTIVSPRLYDTEDSKCKTAEKIDRDSVDEYLERLSTSSFTKFDTYSYCDSPRLNVLSHEKPPEANKNGWDISSSPTCTVLFPQNRDGVCNSPSSAPLSDRLNPKIGSRKLTKVFTDPSECSETKREHGGHGRSRDRLLTYKHNQNLELDPDSLPRDSKTLLVYNNCNLHMHVRPNKMPHDDGTTHIGFIEDHQASNLARLTYLKGRNSWEHPVIGEEVVEHTWDSCSVPLNNTSFHTQRPEASVGGRELAPPMPSLQGIQRTPRIRSYCTTRINIMDCND
ncbi:unnamed protein product [Phytomonas sp. Hart1]|nr:unnamed protein product [Phytomonas sp. Hart1]|eukprot:CCW65948.1 unnamed protein product [Phytomonas sp. isolate Hart1]